MKTPSPLDDFFFDLNGFLILKNAVSPDLLARLNAEFDAFPRDLQHGYWHRGAQRRDYDPNTGMELHHAVEIGEPFQELIDAPGWIDYVRRYCGEQGTYVEGLFIDECIASIRTSGGHHPVHSGGFATPVRCQYRYEHGAFRCGQVNVILALDDIGEGDGATMIIPGSHKSNFPHPQEQDYTYGTDKAMDTIAGAIPAYLEKGDALLFVDALMHGGSSRTNDGERRITIYRYGPSWGRTRYGYQYSGELLDTLTAERRRILEPRIPMFPGDTRIPMEK